MSAVEEAWDELRDWTHMGIEGATSAKHQAQMEREADDAARNAMLVAHVAACQWTKRTVYARKDGRCGDDWYCEGALEILGLGKEGSDE